MADNQITEQAGERTQTKDDVYSWEAVASYVATYANGDRDGACDVSVEVGEAEGVWFIQTSDDAGGDDDAPATAYASEKEAIAAAIEFAQDNDEADGESADDFLTAQLEEEAQEGEDPAGEFAVYWETALEDEGPQTRYSSYSAAVAAADLAQASFRAANPSGGGVTYLCGYSVRQLVDGEWCRVDDEY